MVLKRGIRRRTNKKLEEFISNFEKEKRGLLIYVRHKKNGDDYENPMANYVYNYLLDKEIEVCFSEASGNKSDAVPWKCVDPNIIHHKDFAIHNNKMIIIHKGPPSKKYKNGRFLNYGNTDFPFDFNF